MDIPRTPGRGRDPTFVTAQVPWFAEGMACALARRYPEAKFLIAAPRNRTEHFESVRKMHCRRDLCGNSKFEA